MPLVNTPENFYGGQTVNFLESWQSITSDTWVIENVAGIAIPFIERPRQQRVPKPYALRDIDPAKIDSEIVRMLAKGVIENEDYVEHA